MAQASTIEYAISRDGGETFTVLEAGVPSERFTPIVERITTNRNTQPELNNDALLIRDLDSRTVWRLRAEGAALPAAS
ncbi:hypothetical protein [Micromonospora sp. NPDC047730]|uniref:hypothetical protein n=1 Tax=Micromonospora sp. NPDC047730 TaxID=3364253 RepID=UPI00371C7FC8